jgi:hypothetical protein
MNLTVLLQGGLGNQLFQYAMARNLSLRFGAALSLDTSAGFLIDRRYKRTYELASFRPHARCDRFRHATMWLAYRAFGRLGGRKLQPGIRPNVWPLGGLVVEPAGHVPLDIPSLLDGDWTLHGYWQSPRYFMEHSEQISQELMPPEPARPEALALGRELEAGDSLAIGLRLYEETKHPNAHCRGGSLKSIGQVGDVVHQVLSKRPGLRCVLFCSHVPRDLWLAQLPAGTILATPEHGFRSAVESLWLMSRCTHHVFCNSTLYWWGAWLSQARMQSFGRLPVVMAADNFVNQDCVLSSWMSF